MRCLLAGSITVLVTATAAHAQPALTASSSVPASAQPSWLVSGGLRAGADEGVLTGGWELELGHQLRDAWWLHAEVSEGAAGNPGWQGSGKFQQAQLGVEHRSCRSDARACLITGVDVGVHHLAYSGAEQQLTLGDESIDSSPPPSMDIDNVGPMVALRLGADLGSTVRFRPSLELPITPDGAGLQVMLGVGFAL